MTRLPLCALLGVVVAAVLMAGCGGGGGTTTPTTNATTGRVTNASGSAPTQFGHKLRLTRCYSGELAQPAGHDVKVSGIRCGQVGVPPITGLYVASKHGPVVFHENAGWTCWQRLIEHGFTTDNLCWRGSQVVLFQFSG